MGDHDSHTPGAGAALTLATRAGTESHRAERPLHPTQQPALLLPDPPGGNEALSLGSLGRARVNARTHLGLACKGSAGLSSCNVQSRMDTVCLGLSSALTLTVDMREPPQASPMYPRGSAWGVAGSGCF